MRILLTILTCSPYLILNFDSSVCGGLGGATSGHEAGHYETTAPASARGASDAGDDTERYLNLDGMFALAKTLQLFLPTNDSLFASKAGALIL